MIFSELFWYPFCKNEILNVIPKLLIFSLYPIVVGIVERIKGWFKAFVFGKQAAQKTEIVN